MAIDLDRPLAWRNADADTTALLQDLQGNILKGHGRDHACHLLLHFDVSDERRPHAQAFVHALAAGLTSALSQLEGAARYRRTGQDAGTFAAFFLTAHGYGALGRADLKPTLHARPFEEGLKARSAGLFDPPVETWEEHFQCDIHAMLLLADDCEATCAGAAARARQMILATGGAVTIVGAEQGRAMRNADRHGIEHFGYVDGRSQPLALVEDIAEEQAALGGIDKWNPTIALRQLLVPSPGAGAQSYGSYVVFRKLEQNVRGFKKQEKQLAEFLGIGAGELNAAEMDDLQAFAGACVIGRFENGRPTLLQGTAGSLQGQGVPNNFNYDGDPDGLKCPYAGHIRKANPRGQAEKQFGLPPGSEIRHLMARRGIPYGARTIDPDSPEQRFEDLPTGDVGLLFMACQSDLAQQFEFTQKSWLNDADFLQPGTGIDPVIGQAPVSAGQRWIKAWSDVKSPSRFDFSAFVTMLGGEYFFAPSLSTLRQFAV